MRQSTFAWEFFCRTCALPQPTWAASATAPTGPKRCVDTSGTDTRKSSCSRAGMTPHASGAVVWGLATDCERGRPGPTALHTVFSFAWPVASAASSSWSGSWRGAWSLCLPRAGLAVGKDPCRSYAGFPAECLVSAQLKARRARGAQTGMCARTDKCPYAHNVFEYWLHPTRRAPVRPPSLWPVPRRFRAGTCHSRCLLLCSFRSARPGWAHRVLCRPFNMRSLQAQVSQPAVQ